MAYGRFEAMCKNHHKRKLQNLSGGDDLKEPNALAVSEVAYFTVRVGIKVIARNFMYTDKIFHQSTKLQFQYRLQNDSTGTIWWQIWLEGSRLDHA
jgi:hypothetical protein